MLKVFELDGKPTRLYMLNHGTAYGGGKRWRGCVE